MGDKVFSKCKLCGTSIYWIVMKKSGKKMPVNAQRCTLEYARAAYSPKITFMIDDYGRTYTELNKEGFLSHFFTCPHANKYSGKKNK